MSIFDTLIADRSQKDRTELEALFAQALDGTISAAGWAVLNDPNHRGAYNYTDLNRVTEAMEALHARLTDYGYATGYQPVYVVGSRTVWQENEDPTMEQLEQYLANVRRLRAVLATLPTTPQAPADMEYLTIQEANAIEQILVDLDFQITTMATTFVPAGEAVSGGDYF